MYVRRVNVGDTIQLSNLDGPLLVKVIGVEGGRVVLGLESAGNSPGNPFFIEPVRRPRP